MATGTKLMKEISDQFLICRICQEPFKDPKTLSCLHTFCCACVQQHYDNDSGTSRGSSRYTALYARSLACPVCRKKTELPTGGVRRLPDNFLVSNLTEVLAKRRCSSKVPPCEICHTVPARTGRSSSSSDACSKCLDCDKLLCHACVDLHCSTKVTQDHSLIDLEGQKDIECKAHPEETVRFYCERCEECICVVCTFQEHKDHEVCSFNEGLATHKAALEGLLARSRERLGDLGRRLKVVEQVETLSKELKERIRDLAISYTSQVRAREKELIRKVDEMLSVGEVSQLTEKKAWLRETLDSLHSACHLTEIVVRDKGVEMLLLKKDIQGKMDHLLSGPLPPEPAADLPQLSLAFLPGNVQLGDIVIPGSSGGGKDVVIPGSSGGGKDVVIPVSAGEDIVPSVKENGSDVSGGLRTEKIDQDVGKSSAEVTTTLTSQPCRACLKRKRREEREKGRTDEQGGRGKMTKSVHVQTKAQETSAQDTFSPANVLEEGVISTSVGASSSSLSSSHPSMQTHDAAVTSRSTDGARRNDTTPSKRPTLRARGTMTARQDVRTLKIQTEDSCLRDTHLGYVASTGSTSRPNAWSDISADVLKQKPDKEGEKEAATRSCVERLQGEAGSRPATRSTQDAQVSTDISLGLTTSSPDAVAALCQGEGGRRGVNGSDLGTPDLLAETGSIPVPIPSPASWIRSRKVQTEISALDSGSPGEDQCIIDGEMKRAVFVSSGSSSRSQSMTLSLSKDARASRSSSSCDVGVMTSFNVKLVPDTVDRDTITEAVRSQGVGVMTSPETRTVYIQTLMKRLRSLATGTDYEGQTNKSTGTQPLSVMDSETSMPQVLQESSTTWTEAPMMSERASSTTSTETSDAVTMTTQVPSCSISAQMRPQSQDVTTNTVPPTPLVHHQTQAAPTLTSTGTVPDSSHLSPPQFSGILSALQPPEDSSSFLLDRGQPLLSIVSGSSGGRESTTVGEARSAAVVIVQEGRGTGRESAQCVTTATGPDCPMFSWRTVSTDTLRLLQAGDKETSTPTPKTLDDWTNTAQPQLINTGVTPNRPAIIEVGVATTPITLMDQTTNTELRTLQDTGTEPGLVVCDSETLTEKVTLCDAQTTAQVVTESQSTSTEVVGRADGSCLTEKEEEEKPRIKETQDTESQCLSPALIHREVNTTRFRRKAKEVQTCYSYVECLLCQHPDKLERLSNKTFTDTSTDPSPPDTHDVATMALSCLSSPPGLVHTGVQTSAASLYDKGVATSFDWGDEDLETKPGLGLECYDAATSTESLPYIGLLSEIDVDELIVIPGANFELVSDSDEESVSMVDDETLTEVLDYVEVGTQTVPAVSGSVCDHVPAALPAQDDCSKHLVSVGVNTVPKVTFEKETCTPIRHLFSKGTMTFFVAKMDKATSTISQTRCQDSRQGGRVVKEASRPKPTDTKVTMTPRIEQRDMAVETDSTLVEGRITHCISKLRNVSQRLNSPTLRKAVEGDVFFGQSFLSLRSRDSSSSLPSPASPKYLSSPTTPTTDSSLPLLSPPREASAEEAQRQTQLHNLLAETDAVLKSKDSSGVRKAQPITTLKTRGADGRGEVSNYASQSFPRPRSLERQNRVKMGSQATSPSRLPLSRYNSAPPGTISTVPPAHMVLQRKTSPRTSPSKIPVNQKAAAAAASTSSAVATSDTGPESEAFATSPTQKVQQRPSLPSISETRTPSSCSDTSYVSMESGESSLNPLSIMTTSHSRTPSYVTSDTASDVMPVKSSAETLCTDFRESQEEEDSSSACSISTTLASTQGTNLSPVTPTKQKKEKKGFMHRFLSGGKKKKDTSSSDQVSSPTKAEDHASNSKQPPSSPQVQKKKQTPQAKTQKGARPKSSQKKDAGKPSSSAASEVRLPSPVSTTSAASSRPSSSDSVQLSMQSGGASAAGAPPVPLAPTPALPPHHYPPLPDPNKTPPPPRKPQPFVYVRQRIFPIQQDNVEEAKERKEKEKEEEKKKKVVEETGKDQETAKDQKKTGKEKETEKDKQGAEAEEEQEKKKKETEREEKEKGKVKDKDQVKVTAVNVKVTKIPDKNKAKDEKAKVKVTTQYLGSDKGTVVAAKNDKEKKGKEGISSKAVQSSADQGKGSEIPAKKAGDKSAVGKSEGKKTESRTLSWLRGK
ncbi:hypothetical protein ACOMHN_039853 [Nucella lapillus]